MTGDINLILRFPHFITRPIRRHIHPFLINPSVDWPLSIWEPMIPLVIHLTYASSSTKGESMKSGAQESSRSCWKKMSDFKKSKTSWGSGCGSVQNSAGRACHPRPSLTMRKSPRRPCRSGHASWWANKPVAPSNKTLLSTSEVGENQSSSKPSKEKGRRDKLRLKRSKYEQSPE